MPFRKLIRAAGWALACVAVLALYLGYQQLRGNFHPVVRGEVYRSAQLTSGDITRYAQEHGIRTVLNLRGDNKGQDWYDEEVAEAREAGVNHINFRMKSSRELSPQTARALIQVMDAAPKPLLIHCRAGADRTGLAAALYVAALTDRGEWAAERQLWIHYGHLPLRFNSSYAMNRTFEALEPYLGFNDS